ncbi:MAG TPA: hypothetical protein VHO70_21480 [Chitinispirillaceae bacterium]|nr:hypothetical protein [Chitinispirillaceae bacterium]
MFLGKNEVPFPDNVHCKRCASKNCRELLVAPLNPGKVIFVHRRHFCSIPDYIPSWRVDESNSEAAAPKTVAETDDLEVIKGTVEVSSPSWKHKNEDRIQSSPDATAEGDTILISAQIKNFPEGAPVTFDVYDISDGTPFLIKSVKGNNNGGTATAEWVVEDPQQKGESLKLAFEASARSKYSERIDIPLLQKLNCYFVEMPDVLFNHNSAVACLDKDGILLSALSSAFMFAKNNAGHEVVLFGHTDTSGDPSYNYDLSQWRAEGIKALLDNDSETFLDIIGLASKVEDYQTFLAALAEGHGWNCHPGAIDNSAGEKTKEALRNFQREYNNRFKGDLKIDGTIGPKTWTSIFKVVRSLVEEIVKKECGEVPVLAYGYNNKGIYPCGESFPVDQAGIDGIKSKTNRRVEIVFFEQGKSAGLKEFADKSAGKKSEAVVFDKKRTTIKPATIKQITPISDGETISDDDLVLYHPSQDQYFVIDQKDIPSLIDEVKFCTAIADKITTIRKEISIEKDPVICVSKAQKLEKEVAKTLDLPDGYTTDVIDELVVVNGKHKAWASMSSLVFVRSYVRKNGIKVKGHPRKNNDATVKKKIDEWCKSDKMDASLKTILLRTPEINTNWPDIWKFKGMQSAKAEKEGDFWYAGAEASWLRFTAGAMVSTNLNLKEFSFSLQGQGFVKYDLVSGTAKGSILLPDKNGFDIFQYLGLNEKGLGVVKNGRQCRFMVKIDLHGFAMVSASASAAVGIPNIDLSILTGKKSKGVDANVSAQADAFAGATAGAGLKPSLQWSRDPKNFNSLAEIDPKVEGSAGAGVGIKITFGVKEGKWRIAFGARLVVGLGGKVTIEVEIGLDEGYKLVAHILDSVDYHNVEHISSEAFKAFKDYSFAQFRSVGNITAAAAKTAMSEVVDFSKWLRSTTADPSKIKNVKDTVYKTVSDSEKLKNSPPETLGGMLLQTIMSTVEESDFDAIVKILESAKSEYELKWILRRLVNDTIKDDPDGKWLQEGIKRVLEFGREKVRKELFDSYNTRVQRILEGKGIIYE